MDLSVSSQEGSTEVPQSCLSPFPLWVASLLFSLIIFSLGDQEGGRAGMSVIEVRCKRGGALLLAPNMPILNSHLGDLCSWLFLKTVEQKI